MRAKEILYEDYTERLQSDLANLLVGAKGNGVSTLNTSQLAKELQRMGYSVNNNNIMQLLQNNPNVSSSTPDSITLAGTGSDQESSDSAARVKDMADKANKLG